MCIKITPQTVTANALQPRHAYRPFCLARGGPFLADRHPDRSTGGGVRTVMTEPRDLAPPHEVRRIARRLEEAGYATWT
ncbi:MAG: hypothetical protein M3418_04405, partial [Gemmatimonadota bacterium]|nr:hypothetical protein [Gemmatimonadota bacterium]